METEKKLLPPAYVLASIVLMAALHFKPFQQSTSLITTGV